MCRCWNYSLHVDLFGYLPVHCFTRSSGAILIYSSWVAAKTRPALNGIIVIQVLLILKKLMNIFLSFINSWYLNYELVLISHLSQIDCLVFRLLCRIMSSLSSLTWMKVHTRRSVVIIVAYCGRRIKTNPDVYYGNFSALTTEPM